MTPRAARGAAEAHGETLRPPVVQYTSQETTLPSRSWNAMRWAS
jgi:hypothetical protein